MGNTIRSNNEPAPPGDPPLKEGDVVPGITNEGLKVVVDPNRPKPSEGGDDLIGGKFKSQAELLTAYQELERKQSGTPAVTPDPKPADPATPAVAIIQKADAAGLDIAAIEKEWADNEQKLSEETYGKLAKKGFDRPTVDTIIEGRKAIAQRFLGDLSKVAGGVEQMQQVLQWSVTNLTEAEQNAYNNVVNAGDLETSKLALAGLLARYTAENGSAPALVEDTESHSTRSGGVKPYESRAQVTAAMKDPKYKTDPAYQKMVADKLAVSDVF